MKVGGRAPVIAAASLLWAAAWRAELVHLVLFAGVPLLSGLGGMVLAILTLPFALVGEGSLDRTIGPDGSHLRDPQCWVVLAPCALADRPVPGLPQWTPPAPPPAHGAAAVPEPEPFWEWPVALTWRHLWFGAWLAWFLAHLVQRERRRPRP